MEYVYDYLGFLARAVTIVGAILVVVSAAAALRMRRADYSSGHLELHRINDDLERMEATIRGALLPPAAAKAERRRSAKARKKARKTVSEGTRRVFVLDFDGDLQASGVERLRNEVTAILTLAGGDDEVVVKVHSPGGLVHAYGLAASQLTRLKSAGVRLTAVVDKVAASGGYLVAAVADRILAAPFAVIGSIGVVAQIPNLHRLLQRHDIDVEVLTAGKYKRTLTVFGENTDEGRQKFIEELEAVHGLFQEFVAEHRPQLDVSEVSTGETWYGSRALERKLVDEISTSDQYLMERCREAEVYAVNWVANKKALERLMEQFPEGLLRLLERLGMGYR